MTNGNRQSINLDQDADAVTAFAAYADEAIRIGNEDRRTGIDVLAEAVVAAEFAATVRRDFERMIHPSSGTGLCDMARWAS